VGTEDSFFRVLRRELEEVDVTIDRYMGILVARGRDPESIVLSAHIDRHGLLCTGPNEFHYAAFIAGNQGELFGDSVSEQMIASIADRFTGQRVQAHLPYTGTYLGQGTISSGRLCEFRRNLIFEIGGLEFLQPGTPISFLDRLRVTDTHLSAQLDPVFTSEIEGKCLELGIRYSYKDRWIEAENLTRAKPMSLGRTELGRLVAATEGRITGTTLQIPTTGYHTAEETASLDSVRAAIKLLSSFQ